MAFRLALLFLLAVNANAALTLHIQHPFRSDSEKSSYSLHILGSAANNYNPDFSESSQTVMRSEGNDWYYFVWDKGNFILPGLDELHCQGLPEHFGQQLQQQ